MFHADAPRNLPAGTEGGPGDNHDDQVPDVVAHGNWPAGTDHSVVAVDRCVGIVQKRTGMSLYHDPDGENRLRRIRHRIRSADTVNPRRRNHSCSQSHSGLGQRFRENERLQSVAYGKKDLFAGSVHYRTHDIDRFRVCPEQSGWCKESQQSLSKVWNDSWRLSLSGHTGVIDGPAIRGWIRQSSSQPPATFR